MQLTFTLIALGCAPYVSAESLRHSLFLNDSTKVNRTIDDEFESLRNAAFQPEIQSLLGEAYFSNQTAVLNGTSYTHAQLVAAYKSIFDIQYFHNSTEVDTLGDPAVQAFSSSLSSYDRKHFRRLLKEQRKASQSEAEAFSDYLTTKTFVGCASSAPWGNLTAFLSCRDLMHSSNHSLLLSDIFRRAGILNMIDRCRRMLTAAVWMQIAGIIIACILAAPEMVLPILALIFVPLVAEFIGAGCLAITGDAMRSLDEGLRVNTSAGDSAGTQ